MRATSLTLWVRGACLFAVVGAVLVLTGCSRPTGSVSGKVTFMNKTVRGGNVMFVSTEGLQSGASVINEDGTYSIPKLTAGKYKVCVETASFKPQPFAGSPTTGLNTPKGQKLDPNTPIPEGYTPSNPADAGLAGAAVKRAKLYTAIPEKYATPDSTDIEYEVVGGSQTKDLELK